MNNIMYISLFSDAETVKLYGYYAVQNIQNGDPHRIAGIACCLIQHGDAWNKCSFNYVSEM